MPKILLIEDDKQLSDMIAAWLAFEHHQAEMVEGGDEALHRLKVVEYDLIILDLTLPGMGGLEILKEFRGTGGTTPILILTGRGAIHDKETAFEAGADDYLTKPFHGKELVARTKALLRRSTGDFHGEVLKFGNIVLDRSMHNVTKDGQAVHLVPKEFALLEFLMRNPKRVFSPEALLTRVWSTDADATSEALTTCIKRLRKKLDTGGQPSLIKSVYGVGYKLE